MGVELPLMLHDEIKRCWPQLFTGILKQNRLVASNVLWCQRIPPFGQMALTLAVTLIALKLKGAANSPATIFGQVWGNRRFIKDINGELYYHSQVQAQVCGPTHYGAILV